MLDLHHTFLVKKNKKLSLFTVSWKDQQKCVYGETGDTNYMFFFFLLIIHFQKNEAEAEQLFTNIDQYTNIDFTVYIGTEKRVNSKKTCNKDGCKSGFQVTSYVVVHASALSMTCWFTKK